MKVISALLSHPVWAGIGGVVGLGSLILAVVALQQSVAPKPPSAETITPSPPTTSPVTAERPLKLSLMKQTGVKRQSSRSAAVPKLDREHPEPDFVVTSVHRVSLLYDPDGFEFELEAVDKARFAQFTREHLGRFMFLEWGPEPLAMVRFTTTALDGCITVSPAEKWSMSEFLYLCQLYNLEQQR